MGGYITKPWMGLLALNGVIDYLDLFPNETPFCEAVKKFADWLMAERWERDGAITWSYQHDFNGGRRFLDPFNNRWVELPSKAPWHQENLARLLGYCTLQFRDPRYLDAWAASSAVLTPEVQDHAMSAALQFLPWIQAKLWQATLTRTGIQLRPLHFGSRTPKHATILSPQGGVKVSWTKRGTLCVPRSVTRPALRNRLR